MSMKDWPPPYHQPDPLRECSFYAIAYLCRCLGFPETPAQQAMDWRAETGQHESQYPRQVGGLEMVSWWQYAHAEATPALEAERLRFWLGPNGRSWVEQFLRAGYLGLGNIHRIPELHHCVAVLECNDAGVLLMDPVAGFVTEPWEWFLGPGAGHRCHRIEAWYRLPREDTHV
jgi:hypothetical protein